jgi:hypothetical protein
MDSDTLIAAKPRIDAWDALLTEAQRWSVYYMMRRASWTQVAAWIEKELQCNPPSRTALYAFTARMRKAESCHRIEQAVLARQEAGELASKGAQNDADLIEAFKAMAADVAFRTGDVEAATAYTKLALELADSKNKKTELDLKAAAQSTKDKQLKLAREKFEAAEKRLNAVRDALTDAKAGGGLTEETLKKIEQAAGLL